MYEYVETKAVRNYDILLPKNGRCDLCKRAFISVFMMVPEQKLHNSDNVFLCSGCLTKCGFDISEHTIDILNTLIDKGA